MSIPLMSRNTTYERDDPGEPIRSDGVGEVPLLVRWGKILPRFQGIVTRGKSLVRWATEKRAPGVDSLGAVLVNSLQGDGQGRVHPGGHEVSRARHSEFWERGHAS